ncbi:MAG: Fpg/Nei family DNA glycosylase [Armatimonadetes bacterium]|nr:Fpg/Nei family DNA glycosylase [Armatimonadota bacterium]
MPELPDVVGLKTYLDATSLHHEITRTRVHDDRLLEHTTTRQLAQQLVGAELEESTRHGKYLFSKISSGGWLLLHFGMTGDLKHYKKSEEAPEYAVVTLDFANGSHLAYINKRMIGKVGFVSDLGNYLAQQKLGPDALSEKLTAKKFVALLADRSGPIKARLMDQSLLAGIGNIYSDEILFQVQLHPQTDAANLTEDETRRIYRTMRRVLRVAADKGGDIDQLPRDYFLPHREKGLPCPRCQGEVAKITVGGRPTYYCPGCQKKT